APGRRSFTLRDWSSGMTPSSRDGSYGARRRSTPSHGLRRDVGVGRSLSPRRGRMLITMKPGHKIPEVVATSSVPLRGGEGRAAAREWLNERVLRLDGVGLFGALGRVGPDRLLLHLPRRVDVDRAPAARLLTE